MNSTLSNNINFQDCVYHHPLFYGGIIIFRILISMCTNFYIYSKILKEKVIS